MPKSLERCVTSLSVSSNVPSSSRNSMRSRADVFGELVALAQFCNFLIEIHGRIISFGLPGPSCVLRSLREGGDLEYPVHLVERAECPIFSLCRKLRVSNPSPGLAPALHFPQCPRSPINSASASAR